MKFKDINNPIVALVSNLLVVYVLFTLCRIIFVMTNWGLYAGSMTWSHLLSLFQAGIIFDTTAILYTNAAVILLMLLPLHWKERHGYYRVVRWVYVVCNFVAIAANLIDCAYFPFTGKRTTADVFAEFSNEGAGNMTKILGEQFLVHWYLVVVGVALGWVLWKLFLPKGAAAALAGKTSEHSRGGKAIGLARYYAVQALALVVAVPLCVAGMRGGFSHAVRPITISNANQYVSRPAETGIVLNTPFAIYRTLSKKPLTIPNYMSDEEALAVFTPIHTPTDSVAFEPKNVVVLILESFGKQHFGCYNRQAVQGSRVQEFKSSRVQEFKGSRVQEVKSFTPFLDSLITHAALTWQYSYANGRRSIEGMPSILSSLPNYVEPLFLTPASLNKMSGLARELGEHKGYTTAFFHGAQNGSMGFQAFAQATGFGKYYGRTEYNSDASQLMDNGKRIGDKLFHGDDDFDGTWAIWDEEFLQYYALTMSTMKEPFMTAVFTASSHAPCKVPERYKGVFPKGEDPVQECVAYSDNALRRFFATASRQPWFKNTLFVITADHTSGPVDPFYKTTLGGYCVPIVLYAPGDSTLRGYDQQRVVEQADIMPTVLSYLHYDQPYVAFGKDMLTLPVEDSYALHWVPGFNGYEFVKGDYVLHFDGQQVTAAYRYRTDPLLQRNIVGTMPQDTLRQMTRQMQSEIQQYMQRMNRNQLTSDK